jgi:hypothetical protein
MSPVPHPHASGNMWLARCEYVQKLIDPRLFKDAMNEAVFNADIQRSVGWCLVGRECWAAEHWIHSHPSSVMPCDLSNDESFVWGYDHIPDYPFEIELIF